MYPSFRAGLRLCSPLVARPLLRVQPSPLAFARILKHASASTAVRSEAQSSQPHPQRPSDAAQNPTNTGKKPSGGKKPANTRKKPSSTGQRPLGSKKKSSGTRRKYFNAGRRTSGAEWKPAGTGQGRSNAGRRRKSSVAKRRLGSRVRRKPNHGGPVRVDDSPIANVQRLQLWIGKIRTRIPVLILRLEQVAKFLGIGDNNLHPLRLCLRTLQLDTFGSLEGRLNSLERLPAAQREVSDAEAYAIRSESTIPAVHIWAVKSMFKTLQIPELESEEARLELKVRIDRAWAEVLTLNTLLRQSRAIIKPEALRKNHSLKDSPAIETCKKEYEQEDSEREIDMPPQGAEFQELQSMQNNFDSSNPQLSPSQSILLKNLAAVVAQTQRESAIWKIERFLSRLEEVYTRVPKIIQILDQLAQELQVNKFRRHPLVASQHTLKLDTLSSLDLTLRILRKRTPKDALELPQRVVAAVWYETRISEVQLDVVKGWLRSFYESTKEMHLTRQQKEQIRSIRGRLKIVHTLIRSSREDFGSLGPKSGLEEAWRRILTEENEV